MADQKKMVEAITSMEDDFAQWYTDVVKKAELVDYSSVRGCMVLRPYGYAIWENIQKIFDARFKETGHENVYMPMFIPESLLQKEKDHIEGFAPEVAWVTIGGGEQLQERMCVRPTSETLFCDHYAKIIKSYRDLPKLYNQWCNVCRWEKTTRPFLRTMEFLWQEGHTMHETAEEAIEETERMLNIYADVCEKNFAMPMVKGQKTEKEKFAGAEATYTIEAMMHDGKALQSGTSHYFGDGFAKAFGVQFTGRDNQLHTPFETSWGVTTRLIGAIIMTHGDNNGLVLPPDVAPIQVVIVPAAQHKEGVLEAANAIKDRLAGFCRVKLDDSENSAGWKFAQNQCVLVRRDNREKYFVSLNELETKIPELLKAVRDGLYESALENRERRTYTAHNLDEFIELANTKSGFIKSMWCGDRACEDKLKEVAGVSSRCIPFEQEQIGDTCPVCGKHADKMVYWGKAY